jgi:Bacterial antitoxin of type II TA system, VapB
MRTTVRLDEDLLSEVKRLAVEERTTLTAVLEQALREMLARRKQRRDRARVSLPTFKGEGLQPGVDLDDTSALLDLMEGLNDPL